MNRRTKYAVGIVFAVLTLSLPSVLLAQNDLTLESLAETVENLFTGQTHLQSRVAAIETRLAPTPTPTKTRRPTATPNATATARAKTARASQRATEVAAAKATVTAQARATQAATRNRLSRTEYLEVITTNSELVKMAMIGITASFRNPQPTNKSWRTTLDMYLDTFAYVEEKLDVVPPSTFRQEHAHFLKGLAYCVFGAELITEGVEKRDNTKFTYAAVEFEECTRITSEALILIGL